MMYMVHQLLDVLFPTRPTAILLRTETPPSFARFYQPHEYAGCLALAHYEVPAVHSAITENKFYGNTEATLLLASLVAKWLHTQSLPRPLLLVPIPLAKQRERTRGYNQVTRVLEQVVRNSNHTVKVMSLLTRTRETPPQTSLNRNERLKNLTDAFVCIPLKHLPDLRDWQVVLVDDVITTGATLGTAKKILESQLPAGTRLSCLALAH